MNKLLIALVLSLLVFTGCTFIVTSTGDVNFENGLEIAVIGGTIQYDIKNITCADLKIAGKETIAFGETTKDFTLDESDSGTYDIVTQVSPDNGTTWVPYTFNDVEISVKAGKTTTVILD